MRTMMSWGVMFAAVLAIGCAKHPEPAPAAGATGSADPAAGRVTCTLECSGKTATGYGATGDEARADVRQYIAQNCNPDDGEYSLFCDDAK